MSGVSPPALSVEQFSGTPIPLTLTPTANYVWSVGLFRWVVETQPGGGGGGAVTIADGADVAEGATTDAAVITDTTGTVSGKLRGLVKWAFERMPASLGQKVSAASLPVVIASDQSAFPVTTPQLPAALVGGRLDENVGAWLGSTAPTVGSKTSANSVPVVIASDQGNVPVNTALWIGSAAPTVGQKTMANSIPVAIASDQSAVQITPATLSVTVTGGANAIATATLPAVAGQFHYITHISIRRVTTAALAGGALLAVTTTNLNGRSWRTGNQASILISTFDGSNLVDQEYAHPLKSAVVNTASTIVCPAAGAAVSWQVVVDYFTAA
jgi:hypothetical protein